MDKQIITFEANEQSLIKTGGIAKYASNIVSYVEAVFDLGENWSGYDSVRAVWRNNINGECISTVLDQDGRCIAPSEVLNRTGNVYVNLVGSIVEDDELTDRLTTYPILALEVDADARVCGSETAPITPSQFEQYVAIVEALVGSVKDIDRAVLNADYTLTIYYSDGTSDTVGPIRGATGNGIQSISKTETSGLVDTYTITYTDGNTTTFTVTNGAKGDTGNGIQSIVKTSSSGSNPVVDTYTITYTNGQTTTFTVTNGLKGDAGNSIASIELTSTSGYVKTYTITFTDGTTTTFDVTDGEVSEEDLNEKIAKILPEDSASGDIASFPDGSDLVPARSVKVELTPIQSGSGTPSPDNVRPIYGRTECVTVDDPAYGGYVDFNQLVTLPTSGEIPTGGGATLTYNADGATITISGATSSTAYLRLQLVPKTEIGHVYFVRLNRSDTTKNVNLYNDGGGVNTANGSVYAEQVIGKATANNSWYFRISSGETFTGAESVKPNIIDLTQMFGSTIADEIYAMEQATAGAGVAWFKNLFPLDYYAYNAGETTCVSAVNGNPYYTYTTALGRTVYGGTLDVVSGVLTVTHAYTNLGVLNYNKSVSPQRFEATTTLPNCKAPASSSEALNGLCTEYEIYSADAFSGQDASMYMTTSGLLRIYDSSRYSLSASDFKTAMSGVQICYGLATPQTYQLTGQDIDLLKGSNNVWSDGEISVEYNADIQLYIEKKLGQ